LSEIVNPQIECAEISDKYGRFITEPLERGYGITIGNAMRRVLLSSLPGAAITWVSIEGVQHEFSTVPHMKEDTIEFMLNVKKIRLRPLSSAGGKLNLRAEGEGNVLAGDIEPSAEFEVVNPDLHLATLDSPEAKLIVEFNVEQGTGYRPAGQSYQALELGEGLPIGVIPVDAIFTPARKVNYTVETISIGQRSYEKLILDMWTDGTISPVDAVSQSAHLLIEQFQLFYELARVPLRVGEKQPRLPVPLEQYNMQIEELGLSVRTFNCLKRSGITKAGELLEKSDDELINIKNFGRKALDEVKQQLKEKGFISEDDAITEEGSDEGSQVDSEQKPEGPPEDASL
jgi:DNA-directed RNA polymerase subunit alpha